MLHFLKMLENLYEKWPEMDYGISRGLILIIEILYDGLRANGSHFNITMVQRRI